MYFNVFVKLRPQFKT